MSIPRGFMISMLSLKVRKRADQARVEQRYAANLCTNVKAVKPGSSEHIDCPNKRTGSRGQCIACNAAFERFLATLPEDQRAMAEAEAINRGWILAPQEGRELKTTHLFKSLVS